MQRFVHFKGIQTLDMRCCDQATITDAAFQHLRGIKVLQMYFCRAVCIQAAKDAGLPVEKKKKRVNFCTRSSRRPPSVPFHLEGSPSPFLSPLGPLTHFG